MESKGRIFVLVHSAGADWCLEDGRLDVLLVEICAMFQRRSMGCVRTNVYRGKPDALDVRSVFLFTPSPMLAIHPHTIWWGLARILIE